MKKSRYSDSQIMSILRQADTGVPVPELCREHGMSSATFYQWRAKYGGMSSAMITEKRQLEAENTRLKRLLAEAQLHNDILKEVIAKKL